MLEFTVREPRIFLALDGDEARVSYEATEPIGDLLCVVPLETMTDIALVSRIRRGIPLTSVPGGWTLDPRADASGGTYMETEVVYSSSGVFLKQARSTNGTFVNGTKVTEAVLQAHDRIRLGQIELVVRQSDLGPQGREVNAVSYDVGWQQGNI
jgi:FHA domain